MPRRGRSGTGRRAWRVAGHGADDGLRQRREEHERHLAVPLLRALRALREELGERAPRAHRDGRLGNLAHDVRDGAAHRGDGLAHDALEQRVLKLLLARRRKRRPVRQDFALEDHRGELPHARVGVPARVAKERGDARPRASRTSALSVASATPRDSFSADSNARRISGRCSSAAPDAGAAAAGALSLARGGMRPRRRTLDAHRIRRRVFGSRRAVGGGGAAASWVEGDSRRERKTRRNR